MKDPELIIIVAASLNDVIGKDGNTPWDIPEDRQHFKNLTLNHPVIMGRKTYESIPPRFRPLPQRKNIVLSSSLEEIPEIYIARSMKEAIELVDGQDAYVMGGAQVYREFFNITSRIELTRVERKYEGDAFFPRIDLTVWKKVGKDEDGVSRTGIPYSFQRYERA
ncbi:MAG: dihydrofolate reductase [Candidatus Pacearchaeota archaeon]|jgi:dihydrofolate reductase